MEITGSEAVFSYFKRLFFRSIIGRQTGQYCSNKELMSLENPFNKSVIVYYDQSKMKLELIYSEFTLGNPSYFFLGNKTHNWDEHLLYCSLETKEQFQQTCWANLNA